MCGICGYYGARVPAKLPLAKLGHRGPDGRGEVGEGGYRFGHTRLAIVDVAGGRQPMSNEDGSILLTFNGEIYNHRHLRAGSRRRHVFRTNSDTESIIHLFEEEGPAGLARLDGMFALALAGPDGLVLARDPLGIKPLYYREDEDGLYFASELKAFADLSGVREFPPGCVHVNGRGWKRYYDLPESYREDLSWEHSLDGLRERMVAAVNKRLMADVPLGTFLSGGLDSSLITALVKEGKEDLHTFSVSLATSNDREYAQMAAAYLGTKHHECIITPDEIWAVLPEVIYHLESFDRSLVRSAVPNYFLARIAAQEVKVVLTGEGADEIFAGYAYLEQFSDWDDLHRELREITDELHNTNLQRVDRMTMAHGLEARVPFLDTGVIDWGLGIPPWFKRDRANGTAKWCLREAFTGGLLPEEIRLRDKEKFAEGAGIADLLAVMAEERVDEAEFQRELARGTPLRSKEEYHYYRLFRAHFPTEQAVDLVGRSRS